MELAADERSDAFDREKDDMLLKSEEPVVDTASVRRVNGVPTLIVGGREYPLSAHDVHSLFREISKIAGSV